MMRTNLPGGGGRLPRSPVRGARARCLAVGGALVMLALTACEGSRGEPPPAEKHRGVSWTAGPEITPEALEPLSRLYVNWIVLTPFGWQEAHDSTEVVLRTDEGVFWGERDVGLEKTAAWARELGIKTLLKPHIWLTAPGGKWRSDIEMAGEEEWQRWFSSYRRFILHYARLAERTGMEGLVVGTELYRTAVARPAEWRRLIREVRRVYSGELTYAANWYLEFEEVVFWDELDYIGVQAYFPLSDGTGRPTLAELEAAWAGPIASLGAVHERYGKPVLFTEIGYKSTPGATREPWRWLVRSEAATAEVDLEVQALAYEAFFSTVWHREWFAGAYFWKWLPPLGAELPPGLVRVGPAHEGPGPGFSPQGKPAEEVLRRRYAAAARAADRSGPRRHPG